MNRRHLPALLLTILTLAPCARGQESIVAARAVIVREMPHLASQIHLSLVAGSYAGKSDGFRISGHRGDIQVEAATVPTLLFGVNWYLKYVALMDVSTNGSQLGRAGAVLPAVNPTITRPALYSFRYALNENTDGYTTPYWDFDRWQHEIDILALSGFNAVLVQRGNDLAVYKAFRDVGYSDSEIRQWITAPAHQNWQWMGNMCCFIEPISLDLLRKRAASARRIVDLLRTLGITPVLPGFEGLETNPFAYELYTEMAWHSEPVDLGEWTHAYPLRRYGKEDAHASKAWNIIAQTAYGYRADGVKNHGERDAAHESLFNAQPTLAATRNGTWSPDVMRYVALGLADSYTEIGPRAYTSWTGQMYEGFIQDSWKVTAKLHLDYGIRVTTLTPYKPAWGNAAYFDPASYDKTKVPIVSPATGNITLGTGNAYNGVVIPGFSSFPSSAAAHGVLGSEPNSTACAGGPCTALFAPNLSKGYVDISTTVQPRLGVAYQIDPKTVFRAGAGEFATRMGLLDNIFPGGNSPFQPFVTVAAVAGNFASMVDNPGVALNPTVAPPITVTSLTKNLKSPIRWNWNFTFQRELPLSSTFTIAYVGSRGYYNWRVLDINQPTVGALQANPGKNVNYLRPYLGFAAIQQEQSNGGARYNAMQLSWDRRFVNNLMFGVSYTWSKSTDDSSNYRDIVPDTYNTTNLWGPSEYDTRQIVVVNYLYALPFFQNQNTLTAKLIGGWQLSGSSQFQTGQPCGVGTSSNDYAGVGEVGSFGCGTNTSEGQFWVINGTPRRLKQFSGYPGQSNNKYISTTNPDGSAIFTPPTAGTFNLQKGVRDNIYGPGFQNWNLNLKKMFPINERAGFQFTADAYNFVNHPNWAQIGQAGGLNLTPTAGTFGQVTQKSTTNPRNLQVGLKFLF